MTERLQLILGHIVGFKPSTLTTGSVLASMLVAGVDIKSRMGSYGMTPDLAKNTLERLTEMIRTSQEKTSPAFRAAYKTARESAQVIEGFAQDHPVFALVVALGVLAIMAPWILHLLGFTELGPASGWFAAAWQSTYGAAVPSKSLFAYLQSLGTVGML
ncbi:hypothetical protein N0V94_004785 [Neodidymelliopsis sp. IMI 364377]|nr:hypothetical protein N0V94_004785 [Neodidymelliopsis sp. IMI 364377]